MTRGEYYKRIGQDIDLMNLFGVDLDEEITIEDCIASFNILNNAHKILNSAHKEVLNEIRKTCWHTGTPTEEGWYLQRIKSKNKISYDTDYYENGDWKYSCVFREIVAWQKIEEGEEVNG